MSDEQDEATENTPLDFQTALDVDGVEVPAYGYERKGFFVVNARVSECHRFTVEPSYYGLTEAQADELEKLNAGRNLGAYS